ncbi:hypothetical protein ACFOY2_01830 [Nonomuraea purpurea]|uniref:Transposase n=1 Tax=Nonomuraea purpurea TaxID=1849276 RepID=A0ABV8FYL4_9ACTN
MSGSRPTPEQWEAALYRLRQLSDQGRSVTAEVKATAARLGVAERTVWRRLSRPRRPRPRFTLSPTDIAAFTDFGGNVAAVHRARQAAIAGRTTAAGAPIDADLLQGWADAPPVALRSLYRAFAEELTPAFVAGVSGPGGPSWSTCNARRASATRCGRAITRTCPSWSCLPAARPSPRG